MKALRRRKSIQVFLLEPEKDSSAKVARDLAEVERNSYLVRFQHIDTEALDEHYKFGSKLNIDNVIKLLRRTDWYWLFAYEGSKMVGYALFKISKQKNEVWVVELHTDLKVAKRKRVGTLLLYEGLKIAATTVKYAWLCVDKRSSQERFPYDWYTRMGLALTGKKVEGFAIGTEEFKKFTLRGKLDTIMAYLRVKLT